MSIFFPDLVNLLHFKYLYRHSCKDQKCLEFIKDLVNNICGITDGNPPPKKVMMLNVDMALVKDIDGKTI